MPRLPPPEGGGLRSARFTVKEYTRRLAFPFRKISYWSLSTGRRGTQKLLQGQGDKWVSVPLIPRYVWLLPLPGKPSTCANLDSHVLKMSLSLVVEGAAEGRRSEDQHVSTMMPALYALLSRIRSLLGFLPALPKKLLGMRPHNDEFLRQRMCPFCGRITLRRKRNCLECGKYLKPA
jgi:hypothetical protein